MMTYHIDETQNEMAIEEKQYAYGNEIRFTNFTSCIGIIVRRGRELQAVHLVISGDGPEQPMFDDDGVRNVLNILGNGYDEALMLGHIKDVWAVNVPAQIAALRANIHNLREVSLQNDGSYGARVDEHNGNPFISWYKY